MAKNGEVFEYTGDLLELVGTIEKVTSFTSKGGGAVFTVQIPHDKKDVGILFDNLQRVAKMKIEFSGRAKSAEDEEQPDLDDLNEAMP